jgi:hypothetical protein
MICITYDILINNLISSLFNNFVCLLEHINRVELATADALILVVCLILFLLLLNQLTHLTSVPSPLEVHRKHEPIDE